MSTLNLHNLSLKRITTLLIPIVLLCISFFVLKPPVQSAQDPVYKDGEVIVGFKANIRDQEEDKVENRHGDKTSTKLQGINARLVKLGSGRSVTQAIAEYKGESAVAYAEPNFLVHTTSVPNDPLYPQ